MNASIRDQLTALGFKETKVATTRVEPPVQVYLFVEVGTVSGKKANLIRRQEKRQRRVLNANLINRHTTPDGASLIGMPASEAAHLVR